MVQPDRPHFNIIQRLRTACWITKATNTHSEYEILIAFPRQRWLGEHASVFIRPLPVVLIFTGLRNSNLITVWCPNIMSLCRQQPQVYIQRVGGFVAWWLTPTRGSPRPQAVELEIPMTTPVRSASCMAVSRTCTTISACIVLLEDLHLRWLVRPSNLFDYEN